MSTEPETEARAISILTAAVFGDQETPKWFGDRVNDVAEAAREQGRRAAVDAVAEKVAGLGGHWVGSRGYPGDHHGIDYIDRESVLAAIEAVRDGEA